MLSALSRVSWRIRGAPCWAVPGDSEPARWALACPPTEEGLVGAAAQGLALASPHTHTAVRASVCSRCPRIEPRASPPTWRSGPGPAPAGPLMRKSQCRAGRPGRAEMEKLTRVARPGGRERLLSQPRVRDGPRPKLRAGRGPKGDEQQALAAPGAKSPPRSPGPHGRMQPWLGVGSRAWVPSPVGLSCAVRAGT